MRGYDPGTYGERWAEVYDRWYPPVPDDDPMIDRLAEVAGGGPALELGIGTGRVALPLARRGVEVHGVDSSEPMVAKLREKPGGDEIPVTIGDMAGVSVEGEFSLVFGVFNALCALQSQTAQVRCIDRWAEKLAPGGALLLELFVPDPAAEDRLPVAARWVHADEVALMATSHDPIRQQVDASFVVLRDGEIRLYPVPTRYVHVSELDLMARLAGLELRDRSGGWRREPFTADSTTHVSIYEQAHSADDSSAGTSSSTV